MHWANTMTKAKDRHVKFVQSEHIPIKSNNILVKMIAVLDHLLLLIKLRVLLATKENTKIKTTNKVALTATGENTMIKLEVIIEINVLVVN